MTLKSNEDERYEIIPHKGLKEISLKAVTLNAYHVIPRIMLALALSKCFHGGLSVKQEFNTKSVQLPYLACYGISTEWSIFKL